MNKFYLANLNIVLRILLAYGYLFLLSDFDNLIHKFIIFTITLGCFLQIDGLWNSYFYRKFNSIKNKNLLKYNVITSIFIYFITSLLGCISFHFLGFDLNNSSGLIIIFFAFFLRFCDSFLRFRIDIQKILTIDFFTLLFGIFLLIYIFLTPKIPELYEIILLFVFPMLLNGMIKFFYFSWFVVVDELFKSFNKEILNC